MPRLLGMIECTAPVTAKALSIVPVAVLAGWLLPAGLSAQETHRGSPDKVAITLPVGDNARIKIGPEHTEGGATRHPRRIYFGDTGTVVEFSQFAPPEGGNSRGPPPRLSDLIGNRARQAELDRSAKPGSWVTPPAARR